jgi:hypothetical protein
MGVGESGALLETLNEVLRRGAALERALPAFTSNPARVLRLTGICWCWTPMARCAMYLPAG